MALTVYGIPTCNSCKKARKWLTDNGIEHSWVNTRQSPPTKAQLTGWIADILEDINNAAVISRVKTQVLQLCAEFPVYRE